MTENFDESELDEIGRMLDIAHRKLENGFEIGFEISQYDAELLIDCWEDATEGDTTAVYMLMAEMGKLIAVLKDAIEPDYEPE